MAVGASFREHAENCDDRGSRHEEETLMVCEQRLLISLVSGLDGGASRLDSWKDFVWIAPLCGLRVSKQMYWNGNRNLPIPTYRLELHIQLLGSLGLTPKQSISVVSRWPHLEPLASHRRQSSGLSHLFPSQTLSKTLSLLLSF